MTKRASRGVLWSQKEKNVIFSELQKNRYQCLSYGSRYNQWKFEGITAKNIEDMGLWISTNREPQRSSALMVCIRGWQPCSSQRQQWKWPWWCLPTPQYCSTDHVPSDQGPLHSSDQSFSAYYKQGSSEPKWMLQRHSLHVTAQPQNPLCGAESVEKAAAFATTWSNELAVVVQHILQEMNLETGAFMAGVLISRRAHLGERNAFSAAKMGQKSKRRIKTGHRIRNWQQKESSMKQKSAEQQVWLQPMIFIFTTPPG